MDGRGDYQVIVSSEVSQTKTNIIWYYTYMRNLKKNDTNELIYKTETDSQTYRTNLWLPGGKRGGEGTDWEFGIDMYTLLYLK